MTDQNGIVVMVLALTALTPCLGGALDNRLQGIAASIFEGGAILLMAALVWRATWDLRREQVVAFLRSGVNAPALLWLLWVVGSCLLAPILSVARPYSVQETLRQAAGVMIYFVVSMRFRRAEQLVQLAQTLLLVGVLAAVAGFVQYSRHDGGMAVGPYHDHQLCGSCLAVLLPVVASMAFGARETNLQLVAQAATALIALCLLLTYARSAWIGAAAGIGMLFVVAVGPLLTSQWARYAEMRRQKTATAGSTARNRHLGDGSRELGAKKHEFAFPLMVSLAVIGFVALLANRGSGINDRIGTFAQLASDQSWSRRLQAWRGAMQMIEERPITGFGVGTYPVLQQGYTHLSVAISHSISRPSLAEQAHNVYLQTAAEVGVPGMLLFVSVPVVFILRGIGRLQRMRPGPRRFLLQGAMGAMGAFAVDASASPSWQCSQVSILLWLILGLGTSCLRTSRRTGGARTSEPRSLPAAPAAVTAYCLLLLLLSLLLLLPTAALSVSGAFPDHVTMEPHQPIQTTNGRRVELRLYLVNTDGSRREVTNDKETTFQLDRLHGGDLHKSSGRVYFQPRPGETVDAVVRGIYMGATPDIVEPKDRDTCRICVRPAGVQGG